MGVLQQKVCPFAWQRVEYLSHAGKPQHAGLILAWIQLETLFCSNPGGIAQL